jgi:hypothetical protein
MTERPGPQPSVSPELFAIGVVIGFFAGILASEVCPWRR